MSVWTTKALDRDITYIVLRHTLPGVNNTINGVKFRGGYAVVEKNSKVYHSLKKIPVLNKSQEYPLLHLRKLSFITRAKDILQVYGKDVYWRYLKELEVELDKEHQIEQEHQIQEHIETGGCTFIKPDGHTCKDTAQENSPSQYCTTHLLEDPKLAELGLEKPKFMSKQERKEFRVKVNKFLEKHVSSPTE